ncbi:two-component system cell cycle response regulator DivK [Thermosporothrix hazakensis]|uniref:Two-component system cell cycle response regulator DivK n=2 Tax=Thermosporothrix TaxID=768650 RepID=A0A326UJ04_THEHA|nr:response regulator [Thermosporothrix hazakensis]PZW32098.1 two-component system cell cycle response regulator DivK [Thermosporothrix hazakensis]BBH91428.1 hypothetical protein KTC_61790 [Thermosporothrix sp. COM3]GCE49574.1 hypothetical protein KTH_44430 [Thermosporothrix hazakensis]
MIEQSIHSSEGDKVATKTILVVDDDLDIGSWLVQAIAEETPYEAFYAQDAFEALRILQDQPCDLFLLDYQLPGINGLELYDMLCSSMGIDVLPAIFISASTRLPQQDIQRRNLRSLNKPFELDELLHTLHELLEEPV